MAFFRSTATVLPRCIFLDRPAGQFDAASPVRANIGWSQMQILSSHGGHTATHGRLNPLKYVLDLLGYIKIYDIYFGA